MQHSTTDQVENERAAKELDPVYLNQCRREKPDDEKLNDQQQDEDQKKD